MKPFLTGLCLLLSMFTVSSATAQIIFPPFEKETRMTHQGICDEAKILFTLYEARDPSKPYDVLAYALAVFTIEQIPGLSLFEYFDGKNGFFYFLKVNTSTANEVPVEITDKLFLGLVKVLSPDLYRFWHEHAKDNSCIMVEVGNPK